MELTDERIKELQSKANDIRVSIIESLIKAGSGHTAGPLDMADIFTVLFFHTLNHKPKKPDWPERDRLVLSNGHICPVLYSTMAHVGYFSLEELGTLRRLGSRLQGHPHRDFLPMLEMSSGPLGSGLSQAVGMALGDKMDHGLTGKRRIYALLSDGEMECGQTWEAAMLGGKEKLHNLCAIVDRNNIQIDGYTENVMPLESLSEKWRAWNWHVIEIDGHNIEEIADAFEAAKSIFGQPTVIIAHTIAGKGVKEFERDYRWHGKPPNKEEATMAIKELRTLGGKIKSEHE
ncbi:MAG: transketolase [Candidatus Zambryskibacteria bacterium RIFCSPHIGHO2_01_FULL_49_18]|uniref:Transketolase n=2 Tax=Candidatus Zambryskiibacteriota TaxID=1817925 RepID=A0A1G2T2E2_9BACT|nr:MAG: transketolase [Candidatus Zambryskibacteria bacterium RIFCSPHIGHO2_01_FULL_49_18]OHB06183.1 MAG: transketolase [Candidatus Zambryskibacteria bacterium RIFCSPLOWO2_01_FULL_47_14]